MPATQDRFIDIGITSDAIIDRALRHVESYQLEMEKMQVYGERFYHDSLRQNANQKSLPYRCWEDVIELHRDMNTMFKDCITTGHVIDALITAAIGDGEDQSVDFEVTEKKTGSKGSKLSDSFLADLQTAIDNFVADNDWHAQQREAAERFFAPGEVIRRILPLKDDPKDEKEKSAVDVFFHETPQLQPITIEEAEKRFKQRADFGIVYNFRNKSVNYRSPSIYLIGPAHKKAKDFSEIDQVPSYEIQHLKNGVHLNDPRGYSPFLKVRPESVRACALRSSVGEMALTRLSHAVVEYVKAARRAALDRLADKKKRVMEKDSEGVNRLPKGAVHLTNSERIEFPDLQMSGTDLETLIEMNEKPIGRIINAPDFITLGKSDIGNRATTDNSIKPWIRRIRSLQKLIRVFDVDLMWKVIKAEFGLTDENLAEIKKAVSINVAFPDPTRDLAMNHQQATEQFDRGGISLRTYREVDGFDHEKEVQRVKEEQENQTESDLSVPGNQAQDQTDDNSGNLREAYGLGVERFVEGCGANQKGGGGFTKGNTCAKGGGGGTATAERKERQTDELNDDESFPPSNPDGLDTLERFKTEDGFTDERSELHDRIVEDQFKGKKPSDDPTFVLMGGGPAAGKSSILRFGNVTLPEDTVEINSDEIKESFPEYNTALEKKNKSGAAYVHEESSYLSKRVMRQAGDENFNTLLDGTGDSSFESLKRKVDLMKSRGSKIVGHYVTVDTDTAVERNAGRFAKTGRYVPEQVIRGTHARVSEVFPKAIGLFDELTLWDTNAGGEPVKVAEKVGDELNVIEEDLYRRFLAKAKETY